MGKGIRFLQFRRPVPRAIPVILGLAMLIVSLEPVTARAETISRVASAPTGSLETPPNKFYRSGDRMDALARGRIFEPRRIDQVDILRGPQAEDGFLYPLGAEVHCRFLTSGKELGGATSKFLCEVFQVIDHSSGTEQHAFDGRLEPEVVKVKFDNREVSSEIAGTRLLWALGFFVDHMFAVDAVCSDCPEDPAKGVGPVGTYRFENAAIERRIEGIRMKAPDGSEGWTWDEFIETSGLPQAQVDGFKMLASVLMYSDNKSEQQALLCSGLEVHREMEPPGIQCLKPRLMVSDLGATFGGGGRITSSKSKMNLSGWSKKDVWKHREGEHGPRCQALLVKSWAAREGLKNPLISEAGRRFASRLLCALSDGQLRDLFQASLIDRLPEYRDSQGNFKQGLNEEVVLESWVAEFQWRRQEIADKHCGPAATEPGGRIPGIPALFDELPDYCLAQ